MPSVVEVFTSKGSLTHQRVQLTSLSIRHPQQDPTPPSYFEDFLNTPSVQNALGVNLNYTTSNDLVGLAFQDVGDIVYPSFVKDLETNLGNGVRVALFYGDAEFICNWLGGEAG